MCINQLILIGNERVPNILKNIGTLATDKKQPQDKETGQMSRGLT